MSGNILILNTVGLSSINSPFTRQIRMAWSSAALRGRSARHWHAVGDLLYNQSGFFGVSGISDDMQTLHTSEDPHAEEAIALVRFPDRP
ncbi:MAG TPA: hypothetical protein VME69_09565 [Methylocella sp.]|nr:hypothetical protein [Methylocella sp.]